MALATYASSLCAEHDHLGGGQLLKYLPGGFQTVELWHGNVHQDHLGTKFFGQHNGPAAVLRLASHLKIAFEFEHFAKAFTHDHVVLGK